jgi:hypothetical protein
MHVDTPVERILDVQEAYSRGWISYADAVAETDAIRDCAQFDSILDWAYEIGSRQLGLA